MSALCTSCGIKPGVHSAASFPSVRLCYTCVRDFIESLYLMGVADGNVLVAEYWYASFQIAIRSDHETGAWTYKAVKGFKIIIDDGA